jgi:UDP-GlcNAc3NAcA epimerase
LKIVSIVGARPQFIKAASISNVLRGSGYKEFLLHTGQHYDYDMSQIFFKELDLPEADENLDIRSGTHGRQTGQMLMGIEKVLIREKPDLVIVFGDTNSTLAGALAGAKLHIPVAHVEAGLRSFNREMPEEHNRVLTDHCSDFLFCPTQTAVNHLSHEGISRGVHLVGDTMYDAVLQFSERAREHSSILASQKLNPGSYLLATIHRAHNTDNPQVLGNLLEILQTLDELVILPLHPRTRQKITDSKIIDLRRYSPNLKLIDPVGYLDMLMLEKNARMVLTDSGGVQKEAYFFAVPCITLRSETEWVETLENGWNIVLGMDADRIRQHVHNWTRPEHPPRPVFGDGHAARRIVDEIDLSIDS